MEEQEELDFTKKLTTMIGKVEIISTRGPDKDFPIVGFIQGEGVVRCWNKKGENSEECELQLSYAPPSPPYYLYIYEDRVETMSTKEDALASELALFYVEPEEEKLTMIRGKFEDKTGPKGIRQKEESGQRRDLAAAFAATQPVSSSRRHLDTVVTAGGASPQGMTGVDAMLDSLSGLG